MLHRGQHCLRPLSGVSLSARWLTKQRSRTSMPLKSAKRMIRVLRPQGGAPRITIRCNVCPRESLFKFLGRREIFAYIFVEQQFVWHLAQAGESSPRRPAGVMPITWKEQCVRMGEPPPEPPIDGARQSLCHDHIVLNYWDPEYEVGYQVIDDQEFVFSNNGQLDGDARACDRGVSTSSAPSTY